MYESQIIEFKEAWHDEYIAWIAGYANAQGGTLYIGKNDKGEVVGVNNVKRLLEEIPNKVSSILGLVVEVNLLHENGFDYLEISVPQQSYPISYKGEFHYRSGSTKQTLRGIALNEFLTRKLGLTWEGTTVSKVKVKDFLNDSFILFKENGIRNQRLSTTDSKLTNTELMDSLNLIKDNEITRAGILLFHQNPEKWIPGAYIKIGYFENEANLLYQDEVHGSLIVQAEKIIDLIYTKYLKATITYDPIYRIESYPYPKEAIREAIYNAIIHKNYASMTPIQIKVYPNEIFIANDCIFPSDWDINNLLNKHKSRPINPLIANAFFRMGLVETWGRGIAKIHEACNDANLEDPTYIVHREDFGITFKNNYLKPKEKNNGNNPYNYDKNLSEQENKIMEYLHKYEYIRRTTVEDILEIKDRRANEILKEMCDKGILVPDGKGPSIKYKKA